MTGRGQRRASAPERARGVWSLALAILASSCQSPPAPSTAQVGALDAWLTCTECTAGERAAAAAVGESAREYMGGILLAFPDSLLSVTRRTLGREWSQLPGSVDSVEWVERFASNHRATLQSRAAITLGDIRARDLLQQALNRQVQLDLRADVVSTVGSQLSAIEGTRATSLTLRPQTLHLVPGDTGRFEAVAVGPSGERLDAAVSWSSSDSNVATVSSDGEVTAVGFGTATITAAAGSTAATAIVELAPTAAPEAVLAILGGNLQSGTPGALLPDALTVGVADSLGLALAQEPVTWTVVVGQASFVPSGTTTTVASTDGGGRSQVRLELGSAPGRVVVRATARGVWVRFALVIKGP